MAVTTMDGLATSDDYIAPILFIAYFLYAGIKAWLGPLRVARFYDDHAEISGRNLKRTISYSEIEEVVKTKKLWSTVLKIRPKGENRTLEMGQNVVNTDLNKLYSWLSQKTSFNS